jgi:hypothetical protein
MSLRDAHTEEEKKKGKRLMRENWEKSKKKLFSI